MRLDLRSIIHVPGASLPFQFELDLSQLDFYGEKALCQPCPRQRYGAQYGRRPAAGGNRGDHPWSWCATRCLKPFSQALRLPVSTLLAEELEDEENDEIVLLRKRPCQSDGTLHHPRWCCPWTPSTSVRRTARGCAPTCGADLNNGPLQLRERDRSTFGCTCAAVG